MELGLTPIEREVDRNIDQIFKTKPDLVRFFKNHPKKNTFLANLAKELYAADNRKVLKSGPEVLAKTIREMTKTFCQVALEHANQSSLSANERSRRIDEANRVQKAEETVKELMPDFDVGNFRVKDLADA